MDQKRFAAQGDRGRRVLLGCGGVEGNEASYEVWCTYGSRVSDLSGDETRRWHSMKQIYME